MHSTIQSNWWMYSIGPTRRIDKSNNWLVSRFPLPNPGLTYRRIRVADFTRSWSSSMYYLSEAVLQISPEKPAFRAAFPGAWAPGLQGLQTK